MSELSFVQKIWANFSVTREDGTVVKEKRTPEGDFVPIDIAPKPEKKAGLAHPPGGLYWENNHEILRQV